METASASAPSEDSPVSGGAPSPGTAKRWPAWVKALIAVGVIACVVVCLLAAGGFYVTSLIQRHTQATPTEWPALEVTSQEKAELKRRFADFRQSVLAGKPTSPLALSAKDLNVLASDLGDLGKHLRVEVEGGELKAQFSMPIQGGSRRRPDKDQRFLNGVAKLNIELGPDKFPQLRVKSAEANHQPLPTWITRQIQKRNMLENLDHDPETLGFINNLESISVEDNRVLITPVTPK